MSSFASTGLGSQRTTSPTRLWGRYRISGESVWNPFDSLWEAQRARSYFDFHTAPDADGVSAETHGLFPVWGFGDIVASNHPVAKVGERVYGYFVPARFLGERSSTTLRPTNCLNFSTVLEFSTNYLNKFFYYVPRPHLPPGVHSVIPCKPSEHS